MQASPLQSGEKCGIDLRYYEELNRTVEEDIRRGVPAGYKFMQNVLNAKDILLRRQVIRTMKENRFQLACAAGALTGVTYPEGDVAPCELLEETMGNVRDFGCDLRSVWNSDAAREIRKNIKARKCFCIHPCFITGNILFNPLAYPALLAETLRIKWRKR